jgi:myo-inositol-1(or 4)-monophosphatase
MQRITRLLARCDSRHFADLLETATAAALEAGKILRSLYGKPHQISHKSDINIVTEADIASEQKIIEVLTAARKDIAVLAEESQSNYEAIPMEPVWIIDPLDGTTNYAHTFPWFGISIAYMENGEPGVGVIYCPIPDELFCAVRGSGAVLNGEPITVSGTDNMLQSLVATGFPYDINERLNEIVSILYAVLPAVQDVRRAGAAALDLAYVACGRLDGFWETNLKPWDTAAGQLLVTEAGGKITDFSGEHYSPFVPEVLATNGRIHGGLVQLLEDYSRRP